MKLLEQQFSAGGFVHELVEREGDLAIYRRFKQGGGPEHFEAIRIKSHNGFKIPGTVDQFAAPAEMYPGNEKWGTDGFTFPNIEAARTKFQELKEARKE